MLRVAIVVIGLAACVSTEPIKCKMSRPDIEELFKSLNSVAKGTNKARELSDILICKRLKFNITAAVQALARSLRIVHPDEAQDAAIFERRMAKLNQSVTAYLDHADADTSTFIRNEMLRAHRFRITVEQRKNSSEYKMLRLIFSGHSEQAANETDQMENKLAFVSKVIHDGFDPYNSSFYQLLLEYAGKLSNPEVAILCHQKIYDKMNRSGHLTDPEMLILYRNVQKILNSPYSTMVKNLSHQVDESKEAIFQGLLEDITKRTSENLMALFQNVNEDVLNFVLPELVERAYATNADQRKFKRIMTMFSTLPNDNCKCVAAYALFLEMNKLNDEETFQAFVLYLFTSHVVHNEKVNETNRKNCTFVMNALDEFTDKWTRKYVKLVGRREWSTLTFWHANYQLSMRWLLPEIVNRTDTSDKDKISALTELAEKLDLEDQCVVFDALAKKLSNLNQTDSFETLEMFAALREAMITDANIKPKYVHLCKLAKRSSPGWARQLLWKDTSACVISNRKFGEYMAVVHLNEKPDVFLKMSPSKWRLAVNSIGMTTFQESQDNLFMNYHSKGISCVGDEASRSDEDGWYIEQADENYVFIFHDSNFDGLRDELFLTARDDMPGINLRLVELMQRTGDLDQQWKIDCNANKML